MRPQEIHDRIDEFRKTRDDAGSDDAALLEAALFIEDVFDLCLSDDDICEKNLGTHLLMEEFVLKKYETK
jgi:hypothetical protein